MARLGGDLERYRTLVAQKLVSQSAFDAQQAAYRAARAQYELMRNQSAYAIGRSARQRDRDAAGRSRADRRRRPNRLHLGRRWRPRSRDRLAEIAHPRDGGRPTGLGRAVERTGAAVAGPHPRDLARRRSAGAHLRRARRAGWRCGECGRTRPARARVPAGTGRCRRVAGAAVGGATRGGRQAGVAVVVDRCPARAPGAGTHRRIRGGRGARAGRRRGERVGRRRRRTPAARRAIGRAGGSRQPPVLETTPAAAAK